MSGQRLTGQDREQHEVERVEELLAGYSRASADVPPPGFADRVMSAVASEPAPRRGLGGWLAAVLAGNGALRTGLVLVTVLAAFAIVALAGGLLGPLQSNIGASPSPTEELRSASPPPPSPSATPSASPSPTPRATKEATPSPSDSEDASATETADDAGPSQQPSASGSGDDHGGDRGETPRPSESDDGGGGDGSGGDGSGPG